MMRGFMKIEKEEGGGIGGRPSIGFPLGLALLIVVLVSFTALFSCFNHWHKLRHFLLRHQSSIEQITATVATPSHASPSHIPQPIKKPKHKEDGELGLTVLMPGDEVPKFVALPSPRNLQPAATQVELLLLQV